MPKRIGIFVDVSNMYYCVKKKYNKRKLNYQAFYDYVKDLGEIKSATAYGAQVKHEAQHFITCLKHIGFQTKYKMAKDYQNVDKFKRKADWDVGIAVDIIESILNNEHDMIVLGSADGDLAPVVEWCTENDIKVFILACGISRELKKTATTFIEIPESMLEDNSNKQPKIKNQPEAREALVGKKRVDEDEDDSIGNC